MKYQPDLPNSSLRILFLLLIFLWLDTFLSGSSKALSSGSSSWRPVSLLTTGFSQDGGKRWIRTDLRSLHATAACMFEGDVSIHHSLDLPGGDVSPAGISSPVVRFAGKLTFLDGLQVQIGWLRPRNLAYDLFHPMRLSAVADGIPLGGDFFSFPTATTSQHIFPGIALEYSADSKWLGAMTFGVATGFPCWTGEKPMLSMMLMESQPSSIRISVGLLFVHNTEGLSSGEAPTVASPSIEWSAVHPFLAFVALGKVESSPVPFMGFAIRSGVSFRMGFDRSLGYGATSGWFVTAKRRETEIEAYWKHDAGGFQLTSPVGPQQRPIQLSRLVLRYCASWFLVECQYDDTLYQPPVHGGSRQRRKATGDISFSILSKAASYKVFVKDAATWFPDGRRSGIRTLGINLKNTVRGVSCMLTGEVAWLRGGGNLPELFRGYKLLLDVGIARISWSADAFFVSLKLRESLRNGSLTCSIDTKRRFSLSFSLSL